MFIIQLFSDRTIHGLNKADLQLTALMKPKRVLRIKSMSLMKMLKNQKKLHQSVMKLNTTSDIFKIQVMFLPLRPMQLIPLQRILLLNELMRI